MTGSDRCGRSSVVTRPCGSRGSSWSGQRSLGLIAPKEEPVVHIATKKERSWLQISAVLPHEHVVYGILRMFFDACDVM